MTQDERIEALEKKMAELERQLKEQPELAEFLKTICNIILNHHEVLADLVEKFNRRI